MRRDRLKKSLTKLQGKRGYLALSGWLRSARARHSIDESGRPLPWYTYSAIAFLGERLRSDVHIFEWGVGNSTLWWAARANRLVAVDHKAAWIDLLRKQLRDEPIELFHVPLVYGGDYCRKVIEYSGFHVIAVDGRDRVNCVRNSVQALRPDGVIVWDNTERESYLPGVQFLRDHGFRQIDFVGMGPIVSNGWQTTVFYRPLNCLGI
jgi:hypothetical protein